MFGINLGSLNTSIATLEKQNVKMVLSETSNRTFPSIVTITKNERLVGDSAFFNIKSNCDTSIISPHRFLMSNVDEIKKEHKLSMFNKSNLENVIYNGEIKGIEVDKNCYRKDFPNNFSFLSLLAIYFTKLNNYLIKNSNFESYINVAKSDSIHNEKKKIYVTISVPDFFTIEERKKLMDSVKISNLRYNEVFIINESTAITLFYGFYRRKELSEELKDNESRNVCFIDFGHSKTTVIHSSFTKDEFNVKKVLTNRYLGSRNIDVKIAVKVFNKFCITNNLNLNLSDLKAKQYYRLIEAVSVARKTLTANSETMINIDTFYEDYDLNYRISKEEFEEEISEEIEQLSSMLLQIKEASKNEFIYSVEMAGDALRIPKFQKICEEVFKTKLSKTLAPDELIAKGCCLYSILQSKVYSLNYDFALKQISGIEINVKFAVRREETNNNNMGEYWLNYCLIKKSESLPQRKVYKISSPLDEIEFQFHSELQFLSKICF